MKITIKGGEIAGGNTNTGSNLHHIIDVDKLNLDVLRADLLKKFDDRFKQAEALKDHRLSIFCSRLSGGMGGYGVNKTLKLKANITRQGITILEFLKAVVVEAKKSHYEKGGVFSPQLQDWLVEELFSKTALTKIINQAKSTTSTTKLNEDYCLEVQNAPGLTNSEQAWLVHQFPFESWAKNRVYANIFREIASQVLPQASVVEMTDFSGADRRELVSRS